MKYRRLGRAGIQLSELGLGSWLTFGGGVSEETARACIRRAFDGGINFFDSADVYHRGAAETIVGRALGEFRRADVVIATKCYFPMSEGINDRGLSRKHIFESVRGSLRRLGIDYIDLYQCHRFDENTELFELVRAMDDLIRRGDILYWGVSEWSAEQIERVCRLARQMNACPPVSNQPEYSIAARRVETNGVQAACSREGLGMVVWSPLKQGILTGKYSGGTIPADSRAADEKMNYFLPSVDRELVERVDRLRPVAQRRQMTLAQLAIAWLLRRAAVTSVILGVTRVEQLEENLTAAGYSLEPDDLAQIDAIFPPESNP